MTRRRDLSSAPAGSRISHGLSAVAERQAQQRQSRRPQDEARIAYDEFGRETIVPAEGVARLSTETTWATPEIAAKINQIIDSLRDGGFFDEDIAKSNSTVPLIERTITVTTTLSADDYIVLCNPPAATNIVVTMPPAADFAKRIIVVKNIASAVGAQVLLLPNGGTETIDNNLAQWTLLGTSGVNIGNSFQCYSDGSNIWVL